jgi:hypothetical protein
MLSSAKMTECHPVMGVRVVPPNDGDRKSTSQPETEI